jgi:LuxR family quorum sensing-dependent transcriptional regulator
MSLHEGNDSPVLTQGQIDCIRLIIDGKTDAEIAATLNIAAATAHWHIEQAKKKLQVRTRAQLTAIAVARGFVRP